MTAYVPIADHHNGEARMALMGTKEPADHAEPERQESDRTGQSVCRSQQPVDTLEGPSILMQLAGPAGRR